MSAERKGWDPDEVVKLRQMVALHKSASEIAADLGRSEISIRSKAQALGLCFRAKIEPEPHGWGGKHMISSKESTDIKPGKKTEKKVGEKQARKTRVPCTDRSVEDPASTQRHLKLLTAIQETLDRVGTMMAENAGAPEAWRLFGQVQAGLGYLMDMIQQDASEVR